MEKMRKIIFPIFIFLFLFFYTPRTYAVDSAHLITVVNPVRDSRFWKDTDSVNRQINMILEKNISATWLLQYSLLLDDKSSQIFAKLPQSQELGVFLEVDENLSRDSSVAYTFGKGDWARSDKVLLSGYSPSDRKKMIDKVFERFKKIFGKYPASVGAWYIDSFSKEYLSRKYKITSIMAVSDQYQTDTYGLWGQMWGIPFIPDKLNPLIPSQNIINNVDPVVIQWAQRDPIYGFGLNVYDSTFSLQANDYISAHNLDISYFESVSRSYLFSDNLISQVTVGLEAGQEGAAFGGEFQKQIDTMQKYANEGAAKFVTMSEFASIYNNFHIKNLPVSFIKSSDGAEEAFWFSSRFYRIGFIRHGSRFEIRDLRIYSLPYVYSDVSEKESEQKLKRYVPSVIDDAVDKNARQLFDDVQYINVTKLNDSYLLNISTSSGKIHQLIISEDKITRDGDAVIDFAGISGPLDRVNRLILSMLLDYQYAKPSFRLWSLRFSVIDNVRYFGMMVGSENLVGIKTEFPYFGIFHFPFTTLIHFRTLPDFDLILSIGGNFIKYVNNSTINIVSRIQL